jgi:hypothetical protein
MWYPRLPPPTGPDRESALDLPGPGIYTAAARQGHAIADGVSGLNPSKALTA